MEKKLSPGIYVHLPFCSVHCIYCDFPITTRLSLSDGYYSALLKEIRANPPTTIADTLYLGGGTPSLAPYEVLNEIISSVPIQAAAEITLEANPDHITEKKLAGWKSLGINRLSLGIQSLENEVLKLMLRQHSPEEALNALLLSREAGFENLNADLIVGFPKQTVTGFLSGLRRLIEFRPEHFSIYLLEIHDGTALRQLVQSSRAIPMDESEQVGCFERAIEILQAEGYEHYEVSNFALKNKTSFHNMKYWLDSPYYAYGAGACSYHDSMRIRNIPDVSSYIEAMQRGDSAVEETTQEDEETQARNALIFGLRKVSGIDMNAFEKRYKRSPISLFGSEFESHIAGGLLETSQNRLRLTRKGLLLSNEVLSSAIG